MTIEDFKEEIAQLLNLACLKLSDEEYEALTEWLREEGFF